MNSNNSANDLRSESVTPSNRTGARNIWAVTITSFLTDISSEMVLNILPLFLANVLGVRTGLIGLIEGLALATSSLLKVYSGWLSDRLGRRKALAVFGYGLSAAAKPFLMVAGSWGAVLSVRLIDRVGKGIRTAPRDALIADSVDASRRGLVFGLHRAGDTAGAAIGLSLAFIVVWLTQGSEISLSKQTYTSLVLVSIVPAFLAVLVLAVGVKETTVASQNRTVGSQSVSHLNAAPFRNFLLIVLLFTLGNSSDAFLILRVQDLGFSVLAVLGMLVAYNLVYASVSVPAGVVADRLGKKQVIVVGWLLYALIYFGFAIWQESWQVWLLFAAYGAQHGLTEGVGRAIVADLVLPSARGSAFGIYNSVVGLAALPASVIAGLLWQGFGSWQGLGPAAPFIFGGLLAFVAALLLVRQDISAR